MGFQSINNRKVKRMVSWTTLVHQAWKTAGLYMENAVREIDEIFGEGYAKKHPELVAVYMQVAAKDYDTAARIKVAEDFHEHME